MVLKLCRMFSCRPSELDEEPAETLRLVLIAVKGSKGPEEEDSWQG
jgi:hypothetical protein